MDKTAKIFIAGHNGMVGSAIHNQLKIQGYENLLIRDRQQLDLRNQQAVADFFSEQQPNYVFMAAAKVGGIQANNIYRADFIYENLAIQNNVIYSAFNNGVKRLLFLGSSCIYPRECPQPMAEEHLLTGTLEKTNEPYAIAKIAGLKMCEAFNAQYNTDFISVMPTNLYGPGDNFHLENAHVLPALLRKTHEAKQRNDDKIKLWGTGKALREFMYVDDMAEACIFLMNQQRLVHDVFNIGSGQECTIRQLAATIQDIVGHQGECVYDDSKPDGTPRKLLELSRLTNLGWQATTSLETGIGKTYEWFLQNQSRMRG